MDGSAICSFMHLLVRVLSSPRINESIWYMYQFPALSVSQIVNTCRLVFLSDRMLSSNVAVVGNSGSYRI